MPSGVYARKNKRTREQRQAYMRVYNRNYHRQNFEKEQTRHRAYRKRNAERLRILEKQRDPIKQKARRIKYNKDNRYKINVYVKKRYQGNTQFRLKCILRARLYSIMRNSPKNGSAIRDLGCTIDEFKKYLESKFLPGMSWENQAYKGWHIDHIKPLSLFDLQNRNEFLKACHFTNMQPMWAMDNHKKGNRV